MVGRASTNYWCAAASDYDGSFLLACSNGSGANGLVNISLDGGYTWKACPQSVFPLADYVGAACDNDGVPV